MTDWYYADAQNQRHGPLPASDLAALHAQGVLRPETLVPGDAGGGAADPGCRGCAAGAAARIG